MAKLYGKGTLIEVEKGKKYRIQLSCGKDPITGKYRRVTETFKGTKRQAELRIEELRRELEGGKAPGADKIIFSEWCDRFLASREGMGKLRSQTLRHNRYTANHLVHYLGDIQVNEITPIIVTDMYALMRRDGLGDSSVLHCHKLLKQVMKSAIDNDICLKNPMDKVDTPKRPKVKREALTTDESIRLESIVSTEPLTANKVAVYIGLAMGVRLGEALGLTWGNLELSDERPYARIIQQHTREGKQTPLKTDSDDNPTGRIIPIDASTVKVLKSWQKAQRENLKRLDIKQSNDTPIVTNDLGSFTDHANFHRWWREFCVDNGFGKWLDPEGKEVVTLHVGDDPSPYDDCVIEWRDSENWPCDSEGKRFSRSYKRPKVKRHYEGLCYHALRHTHFTLRLASGMDIPTAQALGGWHSPDMLLNTYAHPVSESVWASAGFMDDLKASDKTV